MFTAWTMINPPNGLQQHRISLWQTSSGCARKGSASPPSITRPLSYTSPHQLATAGCCSPPEVRQHRKKRQAFLF